MGSVRKQARPFPVRLNPFVSTDIPSPCVRVQPERTAGAARTAIARRGDAVRRAVADTLESRQLLSVSLDTNGFTVVTPAADSLVVYVSSSQGSDGNNGLSPSSPVKSIAKGRSLLRDGAGDQMLLNKGDVWNESLGYWKVSGKDADQPLVIGSYGTGARPELQVGNTYALGAGLPGSTLHDMVIQGVRMYAYTRDPANPAYNPTANFDGVYIAGNTSNLLFEDTSIEYFQNNFVISDYYAANTSLKVRLSNISNAYSKTNQHSQGMYIQGVNGVLLEGNTFDHNGWNEQVPGAVATIFNHDVYCQGTSTGLVARYNTFSNAASHGLQARPGGIIENNVFLNNPIGLSYGVVNGSGPLVPGGVTGTIRGNVFEGGRDINGAARGIGVEIANIKAGDGALVEKNVFANSYDGGVFAAINLTVSNNLFNGDQAAGLNDLTIKDNVVYNWYRGLWVNPAMKNGGTGKNVVNNLTIENNDFQEIQNSNIVYHGTGVNAATETVSGNRYQTADPSGAPFYMAGQTYDINEWKSAVEPDGAAVGADYSDPTRDLNTYSFATGGTGTVADLLAKARANTKDTFNYSYLAPAIAAYIRAGFADTGDATPAIPAGYAFTPSPITGPIVTPPPIVGTPTPTPTGTPTPTPTPTETPTPTPTGTPTPTPTGTPTPTPTGTPTPTPTGTPTPTPTGTPTPTPTGTPVPTPTPTPVPTPTPTTPNPTPTPSDPGIRTAVGSGGEIIVTWYNAPGAPSTGGGAVGVSDNTPDVTYIDGPYPTIQYGNGYWYLV